MTTPDEKLSRPANVLFVAHSAALGGASLDLLALLRRLPADRFRPLVVLSEDGPLAGELSSLGVRAVPLYQPWWVTPGNIDAWLYAMRLLPQAVEDLRALIRAEAPDLVYTNSSVVPAGAFAAALEGKPHLWRAQEFVGRGDFLGPLDAETLRGCMAALSARIVANSRALADEFVSSPAALRSSSPCVASAEQGSSTSGLRSRGRFGGVGSLRSTISPVEVVPSGVDVSRFAGCSPAADSRVILSIGATTAAKGLDDLVAAALVLAAASVDFSVVVLGAFDQESYRRRVAGRLRTFGLADRFTFAGFQSHLPPWLSRAAVYCCPSHTEGMSRAVVEAMAAGLPVVATDCGGPRDLVLKGVTGLLVPVRAPDRLAEALKSLLDEPRRAAEMGEAGRRRARESFDVEVTVPRLVEAIESALGAPPPAPSDLALCRLFLATLAAAGPRVLLGKKWRILRRFLR